MTAAKQLAVLATVVGGILLAIGFFGLITGVSTTVSTGKVSCGSAIAPSDKAARQHAMQRDLSAAAAGLGASNLSDRASADAARCEDAIGSQRGWAWPVALLGLLSFVGGLVGMKAIDRRQNPYPPQPYPPRFA